MKIFDITITNCKSFRGPTTVEFNKALNIFVGPNGGGKSNLLDILTVTLRGLFIKSYRQYTDQVDNRTVLIIEEQTNFQEIQRHLQRYSGSEAPDVDIRISLIIEEADVKNMRVIFDNLEEISRVLKSYYFRTPHTMEQVRHWDISQLEQRCLPLTYTVSNGLISDEDELHRWYREYLGIIEFARILSRHIPSLDIAPVLAFFSPYRTTSSNSLSASLSGENYYDLQRTAFQATSRTQTSLIKLATHRFASKMREMEAQARQTGFDAIWESDREVQLVRNYLTKLGYDWNLRLQDPNSNNYEILLTKGDSSLNLDQASAGEQELLNFVLGIFAFDQDGGIVIIDEPELHLHPTWQRTLKDLFIDLSNATNNQFIITTHSTSFLVPQTLPFIQRVSRDISGSTAIYSIDASKQHRARDLIHMINAHNNERMFFSDQVVLVEGIKDRLVFRKLIEWFSLESGKVVETLEVHGKNNFDIYEDLLQDFGVPVSKIADFDYLINIRATELQGLLVTDYKGIDDKVLRDKKSQDRLSLSVILEQAITSSKMDELTSIWTYIKNRHTRFRENLTPVEQARIQSMKTDLLSKNIHVLYDGEIEDYLPEEYRNLDRTIELLEDENFTKWLSGIDNDERLKELVRIVKVVLGIESHENGVESNPTVV